MQLASFGDTAAAPFMRSSAKPFQALPFVESGGAEHYELSPRELALMCASHSGTEEHLNVLDGILGKCGLEMANLQCGAHAPLDAASAEALKTRKHAPDARHHNCSGKHSGMLAFAKRQEWTLDSYLERAHPLQQSILQAVAEICEIDLEMVALGTDGCSAPNFALPLHHAAIGYARLANQANLAPARARACELIVAAMTANPDMVAGPGRFDTRLMEVTGGRILSKGGAEGYQALTVLDGDGIGIALKIADGDARGWARPAVALETLQQMGLLSGAELAQLSEFGPERLVDNAKGINVGTGRPIFELGQ
jgi:L-asparaginase II